MDFWAGELGNNHIKGIKHSNVMDSVFNYLKLDDPKINYPYENLFLDNGAFSIFKNNFHKKKPTLKINNNQIIDIQEKLDPKFTVPFDYPLDPQMPLSQMRKNWDITLKNIEYWNDCTNLNLVPALHGWNKSTLKQNMQILHRKDFNYVALGSTFLIKNTFKGFFGDRQPNKNIYEAFLYLVSIAMKLDIDIHVFGLGSSPLTYHIAAFCEIKSSDSSGYRRKAAYGKIILPQTGERYAGNGKAKFGVNWKKGLTYNNIFSKEEDLKLKECKCPECRKISKHGYRRWKHLSSDWKIRAIHNKWVMEEEARISTHLIHQGSDVYEKFIDQMMEKSSLNSLWKFVKNTKTKYF